MHLGTWEVDDLLTFPANTHDASTGAATDADAVPSYRVYEDETGTAILTGSMAKLDDANTVGFYSEQLTLSAANGFEVGKCYTIYVSATVDSVVGTMSHTFKVELAPATAAALTVVDDFLDTEVAAILAAVDTEVAAIKAKTDNLPSDPADASDIASSFTTVNTKLDTIDDFLDTEMAATLAAVDTEVAAIKAKTDNLPSDPADESNVLAAIAAVQADTDNIQTRLPAALVGGRMDSDVAVIQAGAVSASALAADAVDEILDEVVEGAVTLRQAIRIILSFVGAKVTGGGTTTLTYRDIGDTKNRVTATVDSSGNRSAVTLDGS